MSKNQLLFLIAGANGTGKTTLAKELLKEFKIAYLNADELAIAMDPKNIVRARIKAGKLFLKKAAELLDKKLSFALETTMAGKSLINIVKEAKKMNYKIRIIYFFVDNPEVAIDRIKLRIKKGGHSVPDADVIRRFPRSKSNFWNLYRKIADDWAMFYNGADKLIPVASGEKNKIETTEEDLFSIFIKGLKSE